MTLSTATKLSVIIGLVLVGILGWLANYRHNNVELQRIAYKATIADSIASVVLRHANRPFRCILTIVDADQGNKVALARLLNIESTQGAEGQLCNIEIVCRNGVVKVTANGQELPTFDNAQQISAESVRTQLLALSDRETRYLSVGDDKTITVATYCIDYAGVDTEAKGGSAVKEYTLKLCVTDSAGF